MPLLPPRRHWEIVASRSFGVLRREGRASIDPTQPRWHLVGYVGYEPWACAMYGDTVAVASSPFIHTLEGTSPSFGP